MTTWYHCYDETKRLEVLKKLISYVFPVYNEAKNIQVLYDNLQKVLSDHAKTYNFEFIFVNDGSVDGSLDKLHKLQQQDKRVVVINFARNFGQQIAITAGLDYARGDAVIVMDSDLQDPPATSLKLLQKWKAGYDVVYAKRRSRRDNVLKKITASLFYKILDKLADIQIPRDTGDFRLIDRRVITELKKFKEHNRFLRGLVSWVGFKQTSVTFARAERHAGRSGYSLKKMLKFASDGLLGFSVLPLKLITYLGYVISALSFLGIAYAVTVKIIDTKTTVPGWTFTVIAILLVGGVQLVMLGVLGSYLGRVYTETQDRPLYIIESVKDSSA